MNAGNDRDVVATPGVKSCPDEDCLKDLPRDFFVHMDSGRVVEVTGVIGIDVREHDIAFRRQNQADVTFAREDVYYTCCQHDEPPAPA